jgi:hypothetical protein
MSLNDNGRCSDNDSGCSMIIIHHSAATSSIKKITSHHFDFIIDKKGNVSFSDIAWASSLSWSKS